MQINFVKSGAFRDNALMSIRKTLSLLFLLLAVPALARQRIQGWCEAGNRTITVNSTTSSATTPVQRSFPSCTVTVYVTGTINLASLYADNAGTTKTNPFNADTNGYWFYYADDGTYDNGFTNGGFPNYGNFPAVSALDPFFYAPSTGTTRPISQKVGDTFSVKDYGATGDGSTDDTAAVQAAVTGACTLTPGVPKIYFPQGTYNVAGNIALGCASYLYGDGPLQSTIFETTQSSLTRAITTDYSLTMVDLAVNTTPLTGTNLGMAAVVRGANGTATSVGQDFLFQNFRSLGFNFGLIISGKDNFTDIFNSLTVQNSYIQTYTATSQVSNPINAANGSRMWILNNTLVGDNNGDHGLYTIAVRDALVQGNTFINEDNSAVKIITSGFGIGDSCPMTTTDYHSWMIDHNTFINDLLSASLFTYCSIDLPMVSFTNNTVDTSSDSFAGDFASLYVEATCDSVIEHVNTSGNSFSNLGLGGIMLLSVAQTEGGCANMDNGTISEFTSVNDTFTNFSTSSATTFPAINSTGTNLKRATVVGLHSNGGGGPLNLSGFTTVSIYGMTTASAPVSNAYAFQELQSTEAGRTLLRHRMAVSQTANPYELYNSAGTLVDWWDASGNINFNSSPGLFQINGTRINNAHDIIGSFTLSSGTTTVTLTGTAVYTSGTSYRCTANASSGAVALSVSNSNGSSFVVSDGSGSSSFTGAFTCHGN